MKYLAMIWTEWTDEQELDRQEAMRYREFARRPRPRECWRAVTRCTIRRPRRP